MYHKMGKYLENNYYFLKLYNGLRNVFYGLSNKEPVIVYQMGKVGSTTLLRTLSQFEIGLPVYQIHSLDPTELDGVMDRYRKGRRIAPGHHYYSGRYFSKQIQNDSIKRRWKVISIVREPVARNISAFFQNLDLYVDETLVKETSPELATAELTRIFLERYQHDYPLNWFDNEIKRYLGVDVYSKRFPIDRGFEIFAGTSADVLVLRCEDLNEKAGEAIEEYLGIKVVRLKDANVGATKDYSTLYSSFKTKIALPESYIDEMYSSRFARHFYSDEELNNFRDKWLSRTF